MHSEVFKREMSCYLGLALKYFSKDKANKYLTYNFFFLAVPRSMWDVSSRPGIEPAPPALEAQSLNHWTTREDPHL